jgi:hypothetical protein
MMRVDQNSTLMPPLIFDLFELHGTRYHRPGHRTSRVPAGA